MTINKNESKNKKKKKIQTIVIAVIAFILFTSISGLVSLMLIYKDSIYNGIYVENIDISGLNVVDANKKIKKNLNSILDNNKLILKYKEESWEFNSKDLGLKYDFLQAVNDAYLIGRRGSFINRVHTMLNLQNESHNIQIKASLDINKINDLLNIIEKDINQPSVDASIKRVDGEFVITEETLGLKLNKEKTAEIISEALLNSNIYDVNEVKLVVETITPKYTVEILSKIQNLLGSYTTKFNKSKVGRSYNVDLASKSVNGTVLLPGEIFSFNDVVGPRTIKNGYKVAPVIFKGKLVDGVGGGICQVSSTLYNSVLYSQLEVVERTNHTIPSSYVPIGLDATVSYGVLDFKFKNTSTAPIYIESFIKDNKITVNIYGEKKLDREIKLTSRIDRVIKRDTEIIFDENMFEGEEVIEEKGRDGYKVSSYMLIYENGKFVEKKLISKDYYRPSKEIIKKGLKKPIEQDNDIDNNSFNNDDSKNDLDINN
ncbi:VanW family protein [Paramaledivibacter caminithermalis]|jgi:vancomycin resistance protein YoaR|uniref:Vancomycin resistance protein YoaR, contains peptidoglycan-binding and VanW domains n=1 Tax=Paramaledivibacter caminithermalis (strain DSM 15212 / CIP 107654 / DViRD3) TaxID=1121301 RepID=A0A1M6MM17_PARC5|nr:VanW family protein [Paramaledivibacter caminithermalis]SHJ84521.1 Vancomycin resistance protein YoaR, contains peptidoglycan-binding and VanW domains [Paramaledivibacter caminithermalis DSM 15212]